MRWFSILPILGCLFLLPACGGDDEPEPKESEGFGACLTYAGEELVSCTDYALLLVPFFQAACEQADGNEWRNGACPRANSLGYCEMMGAGRIHYYEGMGLTADQAREACETGDTNTWHGAGG